MDTTVHRIGLLGVTRLNARSPSPMPVQTCSRMPKTGCTCYNIPDNPAINTYYDGGVVSEDVLSIQSTNGLNSGQLFNIPLFIFSCVPSFLAAGLANGVKGTAGLGGSLIALPSQLACVFSFQRKFAICLSSSTSSNGVIFFGNGPYVLLPGIDVSKSLIYTPPIKNPFGIGSVLFLKVPSSEYFIGLKSIRINGKSVPLNKTLLSIDEEGHGGTKISTFTPYTVMQTSIYNALITAFMKELANVTRVVPVVPFGGRLRL
ncbi:Eukaryotic aspartyl protease family protein [Forsythia ovata]|uniref:Eukaryotic aspartyl protease family protein n=1 Tax=Forsythia ovata TaxID=205694 RepID=A0ABD1P693_9LAMI